MNEHTHVCWANSVNSLGFQQRLPWGPRASVGVLWVWRPVLAVSVTILGFFLPVTLFLWPGGRVTASILSR